MKYTSLTSRCWVYGKAFFQLVEKGKARTQRLGTKEGYRFSFACSAFLSALFLTGCNHSAKDLYQGKPEGFIYQAGHQALQKGDNPEAIAAFESINAQYPFGKYSKPATLELMYAYYDKDDPTLALATAQRFLKFYPSDPNAAYAYYLSGVIDFNNGRGVLQTYFPYDMADHDASNYDLAFKTFNIVVTQYPNSPYAEDARRRMVYLNNTEAQHVLNIAQFYFDRKAYVAAINRAQEVITQFPQSPSVIPALMLSEQAYQALHLPELAKINHDVAVANVAKSLDARS